MMRKLEEEHWWFVARRKILSAMISDMNLQPDARILEIGCGTGGNLEMLSKFGQVQAVEYEEYAARLAGNRGIAPVFAGFLPDGLPEFDRGFDLIGLFDVLEHVEEDRASLGEIARRLNPGGKILLTVPAFRFLWSLHDDENHHKRRYRKKDISTLVDECGLTLEYFSYFNFWMFPPVAMVRVVRKAIPYKESWKDMALPPAWLNSLLEKTFASERHLLGKHSLPFGISLMAVISS